jgi:hypothetical protein
MLLRHEYDGIQMEIALVGKFLQDEALIRGDKGQKNAFARSSFNRYYYAAFIATSKVLGKLKNEWSELPHKDIPKVLRASLSKELKSAHQKAQRVGDKETVQVCRNAISAARGLADLLELGYSTRVVADYKYETDVKFIGSDGFSLNAVPISVAKHWPQKASGYADSIMTAWRQANVR